MSSLGGVSIILGLLGLVVAVLWIFLPFAVFGMKDLARAVIAEQKRTNTLLEKIAKNDENKSTIVL